MNQKILLFLLPSLMFLTIQGIGELYISELIILFYFIQFIPKIFLLFKDQLNIFMKLVSLFLLAQIFSDLYRGTPIVDLIRGWANIIFFIIHTTTLYLLLDNKKDHFFIFAFGIIVGRILEYYINPTIYAQSGANWKFGYGFATTFFFVLMTTRLSLNSGLFKSLIFLFLSLLNFYLGYRSLAGVCLFVFFIMILVKFNFIRSFIDNQQPIPFKIFSVMVFILISSFFVNFSYSYLAINEYLGSDELARYNSQMGPLGILIGGRQEILTSIYAILESPFVGYGSWAVNPFSDNLLSDLLSRFGYYNTQVYNYFGNRMPTHSHIFGAWINAGIFGTFIWFWFLYKCIICILINSTHKSNWDGFVYFTCILMVWNLFFSDFNGGARFYDAYYLCLILFMQKKSAYDDK